MGADPQILWRRLDLPGHDACRIWQDGDVQGLDGVAVWRDPSGPAHLAYHIARSNLSILLAMRDILMGRSFLKWDKPSR